MYYDSNFGHWEEMDEPENQEFYHWVQRHTVRKKCVICKRWFKLLPQYDKCDSCIRRIEQGLDA